MSTPASLSPTSQLFAWEMSYASPVHGANGRYRTPFGVHPRETAYIGTLIETITSDNKIISLRMSDPTGVCTVHIDPRAEGLYEKAQELEAPSFVYVLGTVRTRSSGLPAEPEISATILKPVSRNARNNWIIKTAEITAARLEKYPDSDKAAEFKSIILNALASATPVQAACGDGATEKVNEVSDDEVLDIILSLYEGRSAPRDKVIAGLKEKGMTEQQAVATISRLMEEGECYAPKPYLIKLA